MDKYAILILAAGEATRYGSAKQLAQYKGDSLVNGVITMAEESKIGQVLVVLGAHVDSIIAQLPRVDYIINKDWSQGMGSSISAGMESLSGVNYQGVFILLADQPLILKKHLDDIMSLRKLDQKGIIFSSYGTDQVGPPAYFDKKYFSKLVSLPPKVGAKKLYDIYREDSSLISYASAQATLYDIDTEADLIKLKRST